MCIRDRTSEELRVGAECTLKGKLDRYEGKLCLMDALPCQEEALSPEEVKKEYDLDPGFEEVSLAGRLVTLRSMGKALFGHLQDATGKVQIYLRKDTVGEEALKSFEELVDTGDILGVEGRLFRTNAGELTVEVKSFTLLAKSLHPMPEKWHGVKDVEVRYRQRYLDLIANETARKVFLLRSKVVQSVREFLNAEGFLEVETPVLQHVASGANAKPFVTYHNYLEQNLFLRIAPELYLKRLVVGGFNRVYELGKNFRNEGVDTTHNPEFTMLEFYVAYWDYTDLMEFTERLLSHVVVSTVGSLKRSYKGREVDWTPPYSCLLYTSDAA
ncbi:MAG: OB-fold nucleic acid binding domain-containing protein, partial [Aquificaceae bacterium]|nr:OB-fold nucleic acid binding domain-containing protein [Aquificaceae bacterium]